MQTFRLDHVSLLVSDIEASTRFYVQTFGWPITRISGDPVTGRWFGIGGSDTLHLNQGDMATTTVTKDNHLALRVTDLDAFMVHLTGLGITYYDWPNNPNAIGLHPAGFRQIYIRDPDLYWIEINDHAGA
jgi:lactoylglutathione lyase